MHVDNKRTMPRRSLYAAALAILFCFGLPATVSAHELKVDGGIAGVLHTDPDDAPVTGSPTKFFIEFDDSTGKFNLSKCSCTLSILENGQMLTHKRLAVSNNYEGAGQYTFSHPAKYILRFTGTPKEPGGFQPFVLNYRVLVSSGKTGAQPLPTALWGGIGASVGLILAASYVTNRNMKRKA